MNTYLFTKRKNDILDLTTILMVLTRNKRSSDKEKREDQVCQAQSWSKSIPAWERVEMTKSQIKN